MLRHIQHQIKQQLRRATVLPRLQEQADEAASKAELAMRVCQQFGFTAPNGQFQQATCVAALNALADEGKLILPGGVPARGEAATASSAPAAVAPAVNVPDSVEQFAELSLKLVDSDEELRLWTSLMEQEHPLHEAMLFGRQLKYLIMSESGILGGVGFSAAALYLEARDRWIGWDDAIRRAHLDQVVCLSRLLIRPDVHCRNLASRVLSMSVARLRLDFPERYGYCPLLLESFCDPAHGAGTIYRAANWRYIGQTKGRGRQDRANEMRKSVKEIYVFPLQERFRMELGLEETAGLSPLPVGAQSENEHWVEHEFAEAPLGDKRLSKRLVKIAAAKAYQLGEAWSSAVEGDRAEIKGYYRFIDQPEESAVSVEAILAPHRRRTIRRMDAQTKVLCIQDSTKLNFSSLDDCEGLGVVGGNQTGAQSKGLDMHSTLAVTTDGLPLGVLRTQLDARQPVPEDRSPAANIPIEEKKTFCWIQGLRDLAEVSKQLPQTKVICVMDREADIYEVFEEQAASPVDVLVRLKHNRCTTEMKKLKDLVRAEASVAQIEIELQRVSARTKKSKTPARAGRDARTATVDIRYKHCRISPPADKPDADNLPLTVIHLVEENAPNGVEPLEWYLLTSLPVEDFDAAIDIIKYYVLRWRIEDWHRVVKSGCNVNEYTFRTAERLRRAIAIDLVIAWRIMLMTLLQRSCGDLPPETMFSDLELRVLRAWVKRRRDIAPIETLEDAVTALARMGGYQDRKHDPPPGHQLLWRGMLSLAMFCIGFVLRE